MDSIWIKSFRESGEHSYHRRAIKHDYYAPFIYHIILKKQKNCESFGSVVGDARIAPGRPGCAGILESRIGRIIAKEIIHFSYVFSIIKMYQYCVMPDHVHLLLEVKYRSDKHLDFYVECLRKKIAVKYSVLLKRPVDDLEIFEPGYCDKPLLLKRSLDELYTYIRHNPHRLAVRQQFPHFFQRLRSLTIGDKQLAAYGNPFLFRNPDKVAVRVRRKWQVEEIADKKRLWLAKVSEGSILVSPFISKAEKDIRSEAELLGARIILIVHEAFPERFKPAAHDFTLCCEGRLLIISLGMPAGTALTYSVCSRMNDLAVTIAGMEEAEALLRDSI